MTRQYRAGVHRRTAGDDPVEPSVTLRRFPAATVGRESVPPRAGRLFSAPTELSGRFATLAEPWLDPRLPRRCSLYIAYRPDPDAVLAGGWAASHRDLGRWLARNPRVRVILHPEPERDYLAVHRERAGAVYARVFATARAQIREGWPEAPLAYCAGTAPFAGVGSARRDGAWGEVEADEYLVDVRAEDPAATLGGHEGFQGWRECVLAHRPAAAWGIAGRGFPAHPERAATIAREARELAGDRAGSANPAGVYLARSAPGGGMLDRAAEDALNDLFGTFVAARLATVG
ncbi:hypothetical protein [Actinoplanes sp. NPDC023714]|uniref:hypothetical protein n=1 Tax=Actinoplanes sp. NPDC023714 TaxID=3154322 RepID=UPI0033D6F636